MDVLLEDIQMQSVQELRTIMEDHKDWSKRVKAILRRPNGRPKVRLYLNVTSHE